MSMKRVKLVGCGRYNYRGSLFMKNEVNIVSEEHAHELLKVVDDFTGEPYFEEVDENVAAKTPVNVDDESDFKTAPRAVKRRGRPAKAVAAPAQPSSDGIIEV
jgi:hypothetical protein